MPLTHQTEKELSLTPEDLKQVVLITIGRGTQNYTCPPGAPAPVQNSTRGGAVAQLFDVTDATVNSQAFADALNTVAFFNPRPILEDVADIVLSSSIASESREGPHSHFPRDEFKKACHHEFTEGNVPKFDCGEKGLIFGKLLENVPAPKDAPLSPDTDKAIGWLNLEAREGSQIFTKIIRIVTAGGSPPKSCEGVGPEEVILVDYAAQYWMFDNSTGKGH